MPKTPPLPTTESDDAFAARINADYMFRYNHFGRLPRNTEGLILVEDALRFVGAMRSRRKGPPKGHMTKAAFAAHMGKHPANVSAWVRRGLPVTAEGFVPVMQAKRWVRDNTGRMATRTRRADWVEPGPGYETRADFSRRVGRSSCYQWIRDGLPCNEHGHVHIEDGLSWVREYTWQKSQAFALLAPDPGYETKAAFSRRVGRSCQSWVSKGLPCNERGHVHIEDGLSWVREGIRAGRLMEGALV